VVDTARAGVELTVLAQPVVVKYRDDSVDLKHFECKNTVSSFVNQVCYDIKNRYMIIQAADDAISVLRN